MFPPEVRMGAVLLAALVLYALLGGADFGGGVWDLLASGPRKRGQRDLIAHALAPVWEVNHIWLILAWVLLFSAFPKAFAALGEGLHAPLTLFLLGVVGRGSAFAFRSFDAQGDRTSRIWGLVFAASSLLAPLALGAVVAALAQDELAAWHSPFALLTGLFTLALFAFLAAVFLCAEVDAREAVVASGESGEAAHARLQAAADRRALADDFRTRALITGILVGLLAAAVLALAHAAAPRVWSSLTASSGAYVLHAFTAVAALGTFALLLARRFRWARVSVAAQVTLIVLGWAHAQYPLLAPPGWTFRNAAAPRATLELLLVVLMGGAVLLIPSLLLLFRVFKRGPASPQAHAPARGARPGHTGAT